MHMVTRKLLNGLLRMRQRLFPIGLSDSGATLLALRHKELRWVLFPRLLYSAFRIPGSRLWLVSYQLFLSSGNFADPGGRMWRGSHGHRPESSMRQLTFRSILLEAHRNATFTFRSDLGD